MVIAKKKTKQKVSIIVPFLNEEGNIRNTLKALLWQTRPAEEIIFVDNNSLDKTREIVQDFLSKFKSKASILSEPEVGIPLARNRGLEMVNGTIIIFVDADCSIPKRYVETIINDFDSKDVDAVTGRYRLIGDNMKKAIQRKRAWSRHFGWDNNPRFHTALNNQLGTLVTGCSAFNKKVFDELGNFNNSVRYMDDVGLSYKFYDHNFVSFYNPKLLVSHYIETDEKTIIKKDFRYGSDQARINYYFKGKRVDLRFKDYFSIIRLSLTILLKDTNETFYIVRTFLYFKLGMIFTGIRLKSFYL